MKILKKVQHGKISHIIIMDISKLNSLLLLLLFLISSCKEVNKKDIKDCKYISGGYGFSIFIDESRMTASDFKKSEVKVISKEKGLLNIDKKNDYIQKKNYLTVKDKLLLTDTIVITFNNKKYKLYDFKNGQIEIFSDERGKKHENCFLQRMNCNGKIIKREWDLTFKIEL